MLFRFVDLQQISGAELARIQEVLFSSGRRNAFERVKRECQVFAAYDGGILRAAAAVNPNCAYFGGSILIVRIGICWEYNTEEFIRDLLRELAAFYASSPRQILCLEIDRRREMNRELYHAMGFRESIMDSPISRNHAVLVANLADLKNKNEISLDKKTGIC